MSSDAPFTKENLDACLRELGKEFRKLNGTKMSAEIVLIGGAAILANYGFREMTYDIDAVILASSSMKDAINNVGDRLSLPNGWLNTDFRHTTSFSEKLPAVSIYYKTFSNVLTVRTASAEYLVAMKLMSGRQYKNDLSDIVGILWEHQQNGKPLSREAIEKAIVTLYGSNAEIPPVSKQLLGDVYANTDLEQAYGEIRQQEKQSKEALVEFDKAYPKTLKAENIDSVLEQARRRRNKSDMER